MCIRDRVVIERLLLRKNLLLFQVEINHFFKQHFNIGVRFKYRTDGRRYFARRQAGGSDLVEQRLEDMVIPPVKNRDSNWESGDPAGGGQPRETSPYDHHSRPRHTACWHRVHGLQFLALVLALV